LIKWTGANFGRLLKNVSEYLVRKIEKMYEETKVRIKSKQGYMQQFRIMKGVRQLCESIVVQFIYCSIGNKLEKRRIGGVRLGRDMVVNICG